MTVTEPRGAGPEWALLTRELRTLRAGTGLSLAALAERTPYSKSSWERYLNGKKLPPRQAVTALCTLAGEPAGRLLALWELAEVRWSGRGGQPSAPPPAPDPPPPPRPRPAPRQRRRWWLAAGAGAGLLGLGAVAVWASSGSDATPDPSAVASAQAALPVPGCHGRTCAGANPEHTGCGNPELVRTLGRIRLTTTRAGVAIRFSKACGAAWARVWNSAPGDVLEITGPHGQRQLRRIQPDDDLRNYLYTPMVVTPDGTGVRTCFIPSHGPRQCFTP